MSVLAQGRPPRSAGPPFTPALLALEGVLAVAALGGAAWLIGHPDDAVPGAATDRLPLPDWAWGGVLLALWVALPALVAAGGGVRDRAWSHVAHPLAGLALVGWVVVQVRILGPISWLQPVMLGWGLVILALGTAHYRAWHASWGASDLEASAALPGDGLVPRPYLSATRAITIDAPPQEVWPWVVQLGVGRAGWYSYDFLDNLGWASADAIEPFWQAPAPGDSVPLSGSGNPRTVFRVLEARRPGLLVLEARDATMVWLLREDAAGRTRLVTRLRARCRGPAALPTALLLELADFPMTRRCLLGIRARAERSSPRAVTP